MYYRFAMTCFAMHIVLCGCSKEGNAPMAHDNKSIQVGGLYATQDKDGAWRVMKVLAVDDNAVHLRSYANRLPVLPKDVDPAKLSLSGLDDPGRFGIGQFPIAKEGFFG